MTIRKVRAAPHPVLSTVAEPVIKITRAVRRLVGDMIVTMYAAPGVGLAAPQVGESVRVFVFDSRDGLGPRHVINPVLIREFGRVVMQEGCLSVPGKFWPIARAHRVTVAGVNLDGDDIAYTGSGLRGRVLLHELDHLDGLLITDRLPTPKAVPA